MSNGFYVAECAPALQLVQEEKNLKNLACDTALDAAQLASLSIEDLTKITMMLDYVIENNEKILSQASLKLRCLDDELRRLEIQSESEGDGDGDF